MSLLYKFTHGLGDAAQFTCVLQHLKKYRPDVEVSIAAHTGKQSCFYGQCVNVFNLDRDEINEDKFDRIATPGWYENFLYNTGTVHTKIVNFLREEWQIEPDPELLRYRIDARPLLLRHTARYLSYITGELSDFPAVAVHYEGNTSGNLKNISHELASTLCRAVLNLGYTPIILDWDRRSPLPDNRQIFCPDCGPGDLWGETGTGDAETLAALISQCRLMVGVDSGPLHVAGSTDTPTIGVWSRHHPIRFFDLCPNVLHLVPQDWSGMYPCDSQPLAREYFVQNYKYTEYDDLQECLIGTVMKHLPMRSPKLKTRIETTMDYQGPLKDLTSTAFGKQYYEEHKRAGLDYLNYGPWQEEYGRWIVESLGLKGKTLLDIGCACGSILCGFGRAGAFTQGIDLNEYMIELAKRHRPDMTPILFVCDAVNMHIYRDELWDAVHSAQSAEHWKPELVPLILKEIWRVTKPGGLFFCCLDTEELFVRQGRVMENEDPTHVCVKSMAWWHKQLSETGWKVCSQEFDSALRDHPDTFLKRYDWDWFIARKKPATTLGAG